MCLLAKVAETERYSGIALRKRRERMKMTWRKEETKPEEKRKRRERMKMIWRKLSHRKRGKGGRG